MKTTQMITATLLAAGISACLPMTMDPTTQVISNEVMSVCSTALSPTVKQRVDQEWGKHATVESRQMIESVANVILTVPGVPGAERQSMYQNYLTCATGTYLMRKSQ